MCKWLEVSHSGFYDSKSRPESETAKRRETLKIKIGALFEGNNGEYGYRRLHQALLHRLELDRLPQRRQDQPRAGLAIAACFVCGRRDSAGPRSKETPGRNGLAAVVMSRPDAAGRGCRRAPRR